MIMKCIKDFIFTTVYFLRHALVQQGFIYFISSWLFAFFKHPLKSKNCSFLHVSSLFLQGSGVCPAQTWYSLALHTLRGVCVGLDDAGYQVFDEATLEYLTQQYGSFITRNVAELSPTPDSGNAMDSGTLQASNPTPSPSPLLSGQESVVTVLPDFATAPAHQAVRPTGANDNQPQRLVGNTYAGLADAPYSESSDFVPMGQTKEQDEYPDQKEYTSQGFKVQENFGQNYTNLKEPNDRHSIGLERTDQETQHYTSQQFLNSTEASKRLREQPGQKQFVRGRETDKSEAPHATPGQEVSGLSQGNFREGSNSDHLSTTTLKTSQAPPPHTHYSHSSQSAPLPTPAFHPHRNEQHHPDQTSQSPPTRYYNPNKQGSPPFSVRHFSSSTSQTPSSPAHYSYSDNHHQISLSRVSPKPFSLSDQSHYLAQQENSETYVLNNHSVTSGHHRPSVSFNQRFSPHTAGHKTLPQGHFVLGSVEQQQPSLEVYEPHDSSVTEDLEFSRLGNIAQRGSSPPTGISPTTHRSRYSPSR